jgi:hypothetical protein
MPAVVGRLPHVDGPAAQGHPLPTDPAFKGVRREVVAQDFVYPLQRIADPGQQVAARLWGEESESQGFVGLAALRARRPWTRSSRSTTTPPIAGVTAVDRYTMQLHAQGGAPALRRDLASSDLLGPWRARWWSTTATRSTRTRWAPARSG